MMLADKIMKERKKKGWSQEELAEQLDVSRQSVSKWEGGLSVPDLDKIIAMSELFGVSTDYLLKKEQGAEHAGHEEREAPASAEPTQKTEPLREVTYHEAVEYMACVEKRSWRIALGVMLCIISPITLILLGGFSDLGILSEAVGVAIGLFVLFTLVATAVALFILNGMPLLKYEYLEKEATHLSPDLCEDVSTRHNAYQSTHIAMLTVGCILCIVGVIPLVILAVLTESELWALICVGILFVLAAVGVFLLVRTCHVNGSYQKLLQIGDYSISEKNGGNDLIQSIYWGVTTALYLAISFLSGAWHITWIIWVLAGVLSPVVDLIVKKKKNK